jgi:hypothetical protein
MTKEKPPYNLGNFIKVYKNKKAWQKNVQPSMRLLLILFVTVVFVEIFLGYGFVLLLASIYAFVFSLYLYFPNTRPWFHRIFRIKNPPEVLFRFHGHLARECSYLCNLDYFFLCFILV